MPIARCAVAIFALAALAGCDQLPGKPDPADRPVPFPQIVDFAILYARSCAGCHGSDGANGPAPPLNDPLFLALVSREQLLEVVRDGRHGTPMPAFAAASGGTLTDKQVEALVDGLKSRWGKDGAAPHGAPAYAIGAAGEQVASRDAAAGKALFVTACAGCHGEQGHGGDDMPAGPLHDAAFLELVSDQLLRRIVITGRADLGMPNYAGAAGRADGFQPLTSDEIDDLVAYMATWRAAPVQTASR